MKKSKNVRDAIQRQLSTQFCKGILLSHTSPSIEYDTVHDCWVLTRLFLLARQV